LPITHFDNSSRKLTKLSKMALPIGPRQVALLKNRLPSYVGFGVAAGAFAVYFTSGWVGKNLMQFVPFYNKKYDEKDPEMA